MGGALAFPPAGADTPPQVVPEVPVSATDLRAAAASNSPVLAADPDEPRFVVAAHRLDAPDFGCALQVSGDRGQSWVPANPIPELPASADKCYAPEVAFDADGTLYYLFVGLKDQGNQPVGAYLTTSDNRGRSFTAPRMVLGPDNFQVRMAIDPAIGPRGRIHLVWLKALSDPPLGGLTNEPHPILAAHSDDGGRTFSEPVPVSDPARQRSVAPALVVGAGSAVHVAYYDLRDDFRDYQGLEGPPWADPWSLVLTTSTDRGASFGPAVEVDAGIIPPGRVMLIFTMAPPSLATGGDGRLYLSWWDSRAGDPDVFVARSPDGGRTWDPPARLNDDPQGSGADQYLPRVSVAPGGRVDAVFLDRRNDPDNLRNDVYYTFSTDGGSTFAPNVRVTSGNSDSRIGQGYAIPSAKGMTEIGSRLALLSRPADALAAWPDTRFSGPFTKQQDLYAARVVLGPEPDDEGDGGSSPLPLVGAAAGGAVVLAVVFLALRRRRPKLVGGREDM